MTNLEAIKAAVNYPIEDNQAELALTDHSLTTTDTYTVLTQAFDLAKADILFMLASSGSISEGGYSISMTDKTAMLNVARGIYVKYGMVAPGTARIRNGSDKW